jgi:hypothetical protein
MLIPRNTAGDLTRALYSFAQLALVLENKICIFSGDTYLCVWFAEFGWNKKEEHVLARAPLGKNTTKIWSASTRLGRQ